MRATSTFLPFELNHFTPRLSEFVDRIFKNRQPNPKPILFRNSVIMRLLDNI